MLAKKWATVKKDRNVMPAFEVEKEPVGEGIRNLNPSVHGKKDSGQK
jgi:hypothetical protein